MNRLRHRDKDSASWGSGGGEPPGLGVPLGRSLATGQAQGIGIVGAHDRAQKKNVQMVL